MSALFSIKHRHAHWQTLYPRSSHWKDWHTYLIGHNPVGLPVVVTTQELAQIWQTNTIQTQGAQHLLRFEQTTQIGKLPRHSRVFRSLLEVISDAAVDSQTRLWNDLNSHYQNHGMGWELPYLNAAAVALREVALTISDFDTQDVKDFFPGHVVDEKTYGMLAVSALIVSQFIPDFFTSSFYCPDAPEKHSLSFNLNLSGERVKEYSGQEGGHGIRVGITLAGLARFVLGDNSVGFKTQVQAV